MSNDTSERATERGIADRVDMQEQIDWANDCNRLKILAKAAEAEVRRENYRTAHETLSDAAELLENIREEYPRYIHEQDTEAGER